MEVYNAAWERNWGFVPLTEDEVRYYAADLKPILDERWAMIAERDGEVLGAALSLPDVNQCLVHMKGRVLPLGWAKFLYYKRKIDRIRVFALGVKPSTRTSASPPPSTFATSTTPTPAASGGARWAGSWRRTRP